MSNGAPDKSDKVLADAAAHNVGIVLSVPSAGMVRNFKTRFIGEVEQGYWIEASPQATPLLEELVGNQHPLAVSFNAGTRRYSFAAIVLQIDPAYRINASTTVSAALVAKPKDVRGVQRRVSYRVRVRPDNEVFLKVWNIPEHAYLDDRPMAAQEVKVQIRDISTGGLGMFFRPKDKEPIRAFSDQRVRLQLKHGEVELILEGRLRVPPGPVTPESPIGVAFKKLEDDLEGRRKLAALTRIVGDLQRDEVRRSRLGLAS